ncbi:hypothetical protein FJZ18_03900 [Candidatus Pacearchaeota archaeon]|nr:hypothetical protein [Candidatus Pacearchaeota archaeon]
MQFKRYVGETIRLKEKYGKNIGQVVKGLDLTPIENQYKWLEEESKKVVEKLKISLRKNKIGAEVFLGGSFAKRTMVKKQVHDIDVYVRFDQRYEELSSILERVVHNAFGKNRDIKIDKIHGSRDYFRLNFSSYLSFEIIPVISIKHPREARNVTDLSYFHVKYFKKYIARHPEFNNEVALAKTFCRAQGVYGAESYIQGFSGYALECLILYYGSFLKMIRALSKAEKRIVIDPEKQYGKKDNLLILMNESKLQSPIILIDPTWKERNALAALSRESFEVFKKAAGEFIRRPSKEYFIFHAIDKKELEKLALENKAELLHLNISTDKQAGDIAGTKLKKFFEFLSLELIKEFEIFSKAFQYDCDESAEIYFVLKAKKEIVKIGPPLKMEKHANAFRKEHKNVFKKNGFLHARVKTSGSARECINKFLKTSWKKMKEMSITGIKILD